MKINRRVFVSGALSAGVVNLSTRESSAETTAPADVRSNDWLIDPKPFVAKVVRDADGRTIEFSNGLVRRVFCMEPNACTVSLDNLMTGESMLRTPKSEASITLEDYELAIGGLYGAPVQNYFLPEWVDQMTAHARDFRVVKVEEGKTVERFPWKRVPEWSTETAPWPPPGVSLTFHYEPGPASPVKDIKVLIRYELYDGIPLMAKWIEVWNESNAPVMLNSFKAEVLAIVEPLIGKIGMDPSPPLLDSVLPLHVETDYSFGGNMSAAADNPAVHWTGDPSYGDNYYNHQQPSLLECSPRVGPEVELAAGQRWTSFGVFELVHDSSDAERRGLAMRKMMRALAPWVAENPIYMHSRFAAPEKVREVIDQCAAVGFEMVILSFGSGFNIEDDSPENMQQMKELAEYARQKNIAIGGYSLLASRGGKRPDLIIDIKTGKPGGGVFGPSPCLCSRWGEEYFNKLHHFFIETGMNVFENDGSYPGDYCASIEHPGHRGYLDSQWQQWKVMSDFYRWCRAQGIYLTVPDWYFLNGQSKTGMGYTENDWSLPRQYQPVIERQDIYDGTLEKTPSMGWMHVPLMQYHGGGSAATVEPLNANLSHYETRLADLLGSGVQAAWRGDRLYDTDETRVAVKKWVDFYKQNRAILNSDIIHLRRPDGQDWDGILHVNPNLKTRGLAMIFNPRDQAITRTIRLPLYYTGITKTAFIQEQDRPAVRHLLDQKYCVSITVSISAQSRTWLFARE